LRHKLALTRTSLNKEEQKSLFTLKSI